MLLPRLITAIVGLPLIIVSIHWGGVPFFILVAGIIALGLREFYRMAGEGGYSTQPWIGQICGFVFFGAMIWNGTKFKFDAETILIPLLLTIILMVLFVRELFSSSLRQSILRIGITLLGIFFVVWTLGHLCLLRELRPFGREYTYFLFVVIWTVDTMAYIIGKRFGKFKLASQISPGKTIEGTLGGIVAGVVLSAILQPIVFYQMSPTRIMMLAFGIGVCAQISDLAESLLKRSFGVKDSSTLLPGHGGILDRFDSFIFTAPLFYYFLVLF